MHSPLSLWQALRMPCIERRTPRTGEIRMSDLAPNLAAKNAIVTGASRGIGRAAALRLARDGFAVVVNFAGNRGKAAEVVKEITGAGGRAIAVQADVADPAGVARVVDEAELAH